MHIKFCQIAKYPCYTEMKKLNQQLACKNQIEINFALCKSRIVLIQLFQNKCSRMLLQMCLTVTLPFLKKKFPKLKNKKIRVQKSNSIFEEQVASRDAGYNMVLTGTASRKKKKNSTNTLPVPSAFKQSIYHTSTFSATLHSFVMQSQKLIQSLSD